MEIIHFLFSFAIVVYLYLDESFSLDIRFVSSNRAFPIRMDRFASEIDRSFIEKV